MFWDIHGFLCSKHGPTTWLNIFLIWHCIKHVPLQCNSSSLVPNCLSLPRGRSGLRAPRSTPSGALRGGVTFGFGAQDPSLRSCLVQPTPEVADGGCQVGQWAPEKVARRSTIFGGAAPMTTPNEVAHRGEWPPAGNGPSPWCGRVATVRHLIGRCHRHSTAEDGATQHNLLRGTLAHLALSIGYLRGGITFGFGAQDPSLRSCLVQPTPEVADGERQVGQCAPKKVALRSTIFGGAVPMTTPNEVAHRGERPPAGNGPSPRCGRVAKAAIPLACAV